MWEQISDFCHRTGKAAKNILAVLFYFILFFLIQATFVE